MAQAQIWWVLIVAVVLCGCVCPMKSSSCDSDALLNCLSSGRIETVEEARGVFDFCTRNFCSRE